MSMENVKKFYEMLKANEGLTQEVTKLKEELVNGDKKFLKDGYVINKRIIPLAQKYGLDFTEEEFASYTRGQTFALSEGELLNISGGVGVFGALGRVFFSIVNFLNPFGAREDLMDGAPPQQIMVDRQKIVTSNNLNKENNAKRLIELEKEVSGFENGNIRSMLSDQDYETFMDLIGLRYPRCFESLQERIGEDFHKISMEESNAKGKIIKQEQKKNETLQQKVENLNKTIDEQNEKLASLSEDESSKEAKIKELNEEIARLKDEKQKSDQEMKQKVENLNKTIDEQNEKLASLSEDESSKEAKIKELNEEIARLKDEKQKSDQEMKQIGNRLLKELEEKKQLTDQNTKLNEKIKAIEDSEKQTNRLNKKNIKELSEVINKQIDKLRLLSKEAADRDTKIKQEQKKNETLQQKVENLNKTIDEQNEKLASLSENESSKEAKIKELNKKIVKNEILNKELAQNRSIYGNKNYKAFSKKDYLGNQVNKLVQFLNKINYNLENVSASSIEELRADIIYVGRQMMGEKENRYLKGKYYSYTATDANLEQEDLEALYNLYQQVKNNN